MCAFLEARLADPMLGPKKLAKEFGISRAAIYRGFAEDGGMKSYIQTRRLKRAYDELSGHPGAPGLVSRIAENSGFCSVSHFSRSFQKTFGCRPSAIVGSSSVPGSKDGS